MVKNNSPCNQQDSGIGLSLSHRVKQIFYTFIIQMQQNLTKTPHTKQISLDENILQCGQEYIFSPFQQKPRQIQVYEFQVSGKTPKYIDNALGFIYKQCSYAEHQFYKYLNELNTNDGGYALKKFIPQFFGVETENQLGSVPAFRKESNCSSNRNTWIGHISSRKADCNQEKKQFLCLKNMTYGFDIPSIIDLKLGIKKAKKSNAKFATSTTNSHKFRINGEMVALKKQQIFEQHFVSKYFGQSISIEQTEIYLALFFFDGKQINIDLLRRVILDLRELILCFKKFKGIKFISSSLFIAYDSANSQKYTVNLIDFDKYQICGEQEDTVICEGLINIHSFFLDIINNKQEHESRLKNKQLQIFKEEGRQVVPQHKVDKYCK